MYCGDHKEIKGCHSVIHRPVGEQTFANAKLDNKQANMSEVLSQCYTDERYRKHVQTNLLHFKSRSLCDI